MWFIRIPRLTTSHLSVPVNTDLCDAFHKSPTQWQSMWQMYNKVLVLVCI